ncbi:MAG: iron-containing alcohol dehydrogenase [Clostridia bacterium]|nr:iron-containing alcohol dehydrogenase [Clostridia bacterium]
MDIATLLENDGFLCECGRRHSTSLKKAVIRRGAVEELPAELKKACAGPLFAFVVCDKNTYKAAGGKVEAALSGAGIKYTTYVIPEEKPEPDERLLGSVLMHMPKGVNAVVGVGGGVINDTCKIIASRGGLPYFIVATSCSMDGFASGTSSMIRDDLKVTIDSVCPGVVIGDLDVLCAAPPRLAASGYGDMAAKYVSIAEWKMSEIINEEYCCPFICSLVDSAVALCTENRKGLKTGDEAAVRSIFEGLILSGIAADYAQSSRAASGTEHYFSHSWDMRSLAFGAPCDLHGIQCGIGTVLTVRTYEKLLRELGDEGPGSDDVTAPFDFERRKAELREVYGPAAEAMIESDVSNRRYDPGEHKLRFERIKAHWAELAGIIRSLPSSETIAGFLADAGCPTEPEEIGVPTEDCRRILPLICDLRYKYTLSTLLWDLGKTELFGF